MIDSGRGIALTEIKDIINDLGLINIRTNEVKVFLLEMFGENIQYCKSKSKNNSLLVFSAKISVADIANVIRSTDIIRAAALELRKALLNLDFQLDDNYCDAHELEYTWRNTAIPETFITFLSALINVKKIYLLKIHHDR